MSYKQSELYCRDTLYVKNLINSLAKAREQRNIERVIQLANEMGRYEALCGSIQPIRQFKEDLQRVSEELEIGNIPEIQRAIETKPTEKRTMIGFQEYVVNPDGALSFPSEKPQPERPEIPKQAMIKRNIDFRTEPFPEICNMECAHKTCSSYGVPSMQGKPCRNTVRTNQDIKKNPSLWQGEN